MGQPPRRVSISDGMIVVAMGAGTIALAGLWHRELNEELPSFFGAVGWPTMTRTRLAGWALSVMVPLTLAVLTITVRQPRPRIRVLARRPGAVACGVAAMALLIEIVSLPFNLRTLGAFTSPLLVASWYWPVPIGSVVAISWLLLASSRRWRVGPGWIEGAGVLVGTTWIALPLILMVIEFL